MKNGENYIQFITNRNAFPSIEGQYTMRTSDGKYHSITYEIPLDFDYNEMIVREYEISTAETFHKTGTIRLAVNGTLMDVKYFVNSDGFHVNDLSRPLVPKPAPVPIPVARITPIAAGIPSTVVPSKPNPANNRPVRNQQQLRPSDFIRRILTPPTSRPITS